MTNLCVCVCVSVGTMSCPTLCDPMNCSLPGFSVHGIFQARILEWVAISYSMGSSQPRDWNPVSCVSCTGRWFITTVSRAAQNLLTTNLVENQRSFYLDALLSWIRTQAEAWKLRVLPENVSKTDSSKNSEIFFPIHALCPLIESCLNSCLCNEVQYSHAWNNFG